jgi:branched-subunit amino acid ABC-type transport system permease component
LIFGLMRTVNMAHGSLFLLAGFTAIEIQQRMVGKTRNIAPEDVSILSWVVPLLAAAALAAALGVLLQQLFLRWNQGQELRQALITIAISVVLADQMLRQFGGLAKSMVWPGAVNHFIEIGGNRYATSRLFMLAVAVVVGVALWLWLTRTRMGMVIRAGVDDEPMVRALGINVTVVFAVTFFVGAFLAGMGGVMGASFAGAATGSDGAWLLNSLVVVIIGGLGSLKGASPGRCCTGWWWRCRLPTCRRSTPSTRSSSPSCCWRWCWRCAPTGCSGGRHERARAAQPQKHRGGGDPGPAARAADVRHRVLRLPSADRDTDPGADRRVDRLPHLLRRNDLAGQLLLAGVAGFMFGNAVLESGSRGLNLGWSPWAAVLFALGITSVVALCSVRWAAAPPASTS